MLGLIISLTCSSQTTNSQNINSFLNYEIIPPVDIYVSEGESALKNKFTQVQLDGLIYVTAEYYTVELMSGDYFIIKIVFDVENEEAHVKVVDSEIKTYSISSNGRQKIGFDKSFIRQSEDKTYVQLTVRNDELEVFNTFKILLPEKRDIEMSRRLYGN